MTDSIPPEWVPISVYGRSQPFGVDWCYMGEERFSDPFFVATIQRRLALPFNQLFRPQTTLNDLIERQTVQPGLAPTGFIFHMSRCGSTLLSQQLAALPDTVVISEATPLDGLLRITWKDPTVSEELLVTWLRALIGALGQPRTGNETRLFIKLDAWHTLFMSIIRRAFPQTPWVFLYRDPVEVLVSQERDRGSQMMPGTLPPTFLGLTYEQAFTLSPDEYTARVLNGICEVVLANRDDRGRLVNYRELPQAAWTSCAEHFGITFTAEEIKLMQRAARFDAKRPKTSFVADSADKQRSASAELRQLAEQWLVPLYEQLAETGAAPRLTRRST